MNTTTPLHSIGPAARLVGRSENTLRDWEVRGLISPLRDSTGRRLYSESDIKKMRRLVATSKRGQALAAEHG